MINNLWYIEINSQYTSTDRAVTYPQQRDLLQLGLVRSRLELRHQLRHLSRDLDESWRTNHVTRCHETY